MMNDMMDEERFVIDRTLCRIVYRRADNTSRQQPYDISKGVWEILRTAMLDAIRHRVNISYYRASDAHGTYFNRIVVFYSWITSSSSVLFSGGQARHLRLSFYPGLLLGLRRFPCIADMHGMYFFCQPTVEYIVAYRASDMHGMYYHIMEYTTTSSSGYMEYYYCVDYNYYLEYGNYIVFVYYIFSSSSRRGFALWASAVDAHLFCPDPD